VKFKRKQLEDKMGLDMYAYVGRPGQQKEFYEQGGLEYNSKTDDWVVPAGGVQKPRQIAYWRKHPSLHGWMEQLWERKMIAEGVDNPHQFNGIELELTWEDVDELERAVHHGQLPYTKGFFFGDPKDEYYKEDDLQFCIDAKTELFLGLKVFYNSSW